MSYVASRDAMRKVMSALVALVASLSPRRTTGSHVIKKKQIKTIKNHIRTRTTIAVALIPDEDDDQDSCGPNETLNSCPMECASDYCPNYGHNIIFPKLNTKDAGNFYKCSNYDDTDRQNLDCSPPTCKCDAGYKRAADGACILSSKCPIIPYNHVRACNKPNEMYVSCPSRCRTDDCQLPNYEHLCRDQNTRCSPKCMCISGYLRKEGICVPFKECFLPSSVERENEEHDDDDDVDNQNLRVVLYQGRKKISKNLQKNKHRKENRSNKKIHFNRDSTEFQKRTIKFHGKDDSREINNFKADSKHTRQYIGTKQVNNLSINAKSKDRSNDDSSKESEETSNDEDSKSDESSEENAESAKSRSKISISTITI